MRWISRRESSSQAGLREERPRNDNGGKDQDENQ